MSTREPLELTPTWVRRWPAGGADKSLQRAPDGTFWRVARSDDGLFILLSQLDSEGEVIASGEIRAPEDAACAPGISLASIEVTASSAALTCAVSWYCQPLKSGRSLVLTEIVRLPQRADAEPARIRTELAGRLMSQAIADAGGDYYVVFSSGLTTLEDRRDDGPIVRKVSASGETLWQHERFVPFSSVLNHQGVLLQNGDLELVTPANEEVLFFRFTSKGKVSARSLQPLSSGTVEALAIGNRTFAASPVGTGDLGGTLGDLAVLTRSGSDSLNLQIIERWDYRELQLYGVTKDAQGTPYVLLSTGTRAESWLITCAFPNDAAARCFKLGGLTSDMDRFWNASFAGGDDQSLYVLWADDTNRQLVRFDMP